MLYGVDGPYGIGKTSLTIDYAKKFKSKYGDKGIVISNIKLYGKEFEDYIHFDDSNLLDVLRFTNYINDIERKIEKNYYYLSNGKKELKRVNFTKTLILFDESGSLLNKHQRKVFETVLIQYINQTRKIFYDLFMTSVKGSENFKQLRDKVDVWYTLNAPFGETMPILGGIRTVYREYRESDGETIKTVKFIGKDIKGDRVLKERPLKSYYDWFYKPATYKYYDDLYKNIDDKEFSEDTEFIYGIINRISINDRLLKRYGFLK